MIENNQNITYSSLRFSKAAETSIKEPTFSYSYTYHYPWVKKPEVLLRRCQFDDGGYMELTDNNLIIFEDWQRKKFALPQIKKAGISFKRLIAPIIIGGIIAPMGFVTAFGNAFSVWFSMAFFLLGILLFYYGTQGSYQVSIEFEGHQFKFFIDEKTEEVEDFIRYLNALRNTSSNLPNTSYLY